MRQCAPAADGTCKWLVARWSGLDGSVRNEWLGHATGCGGVYAEVEWTHVLQGTGSDGAFVDADGLAWAPLTDDDGDEATVTTCVPNEECRVYDLRTYTVAPPFIVTRAEAANRRRER